MSEAKDEKVVKLRDAYKNAEPRKKPASKKGGGEEPPASPPPEPPAPPPTQPELLPEDAPVKALGHRDGVYFYLDAAGQMRALREDKHGRLHIISLFGGTGYLIDTWPVWQLIEDKWVRKREFAHGRIAPVLMSSCHQKGVWDPVDKVRGCGTWMEDDGALVMHCGTRLWISSDGVVRPEEAGVRNALLYPRRPALPEPEFEDRSHPGHRMLEQLDTWSFKRPDIDPQLVLGWIIAAMLGQAAPWRPMMWVTGASRTGKSTLQRLVEWTLGSSLIKPSNTTQAYVYQRIGDSALPVALDEFEAKADNKRQEDVIELMRIAASGGELGRGGSDGEAKTFTLRSCFSAFSILIPPLPPQDRSRMAIIELKKLLRDEEEGELDLEAPAEQDLALGSREKWARTGRQLRARVLAQWPRYLRTFRVYFHALTRAGHDVRAASQFGALGAGCDLALYDTLEAENAVEWAKHLPASNLAETTGYSNESEGCLQHLLSATPDLVRQGTRETISYYIGRAKIDAEQSVRTNDPDDASRVLAKIGIRVYRDATLITSDNAGRTTPVWWVAVSSTHPGLNAIFHGTHWKGKPGAPGTWAQALRGLPGASENAVRMRIDGNRHWVTAIQFDTVLPPFNDTEDADEIREVAMQDRASSSKERLV